MNAIIKNLVKAKEAAYHAASNTTDDNSKAYYALIDEIQVAIESAQKIADAEQQILVASQGPTWMDLV